MHRDELPIHEPCHADWTAMSGDAARRFCGSCTKHVHDLSAMTADDAETLLATEKNLCVRYAVAPDGRVLHAPRPSRLPRLLAIGAALLGGVPAFASGAVAQPSTSSEPGMMERVLKMAQEAVGYARETVVSAGPVVVMGEMPPEPPPPPPPELIMGQMIAPPVIQLPKIPPGQTVIPEVEAASKTR
jgi:hypothetical protein